MLLDNLLGLAAEAESDAEAYEVAAREAVRALVAPKGKVDPTLLEREQFAAHGFAWIATYVAALRQMRRWAEGGGKSGNGGELELLMLQSAFGEYLAQLSGGIAISQVEIVRPADLGIDAAALDTLAVKKLIAGNTSAVRLRIAELIADGLDSGNFGALELGDEALEEVRGQFRRFVEAEVAPHRPRLASARRADPAAGGREDGRARRLRPHRARGMGRARHGQARHVRRHRGAVARLYRRRLARHALGDRRRADRAGGTRGAEEALPRRASPRARSCRPRSSPSPTPAPTWRACAPARSARATSTRSTATRPGSPTPRAPT